MDYITINLDTDPKEYIHFEGSHVLDAINWCKQNINVGDWDVTTHFPSFRYTFKFRDAGHAATFALRWL